MDIFGNSSKGTPGFWEVQVQMAPEVHKYLGILLLLHQAFKMLGLWGHQEYKNSLILLNQPRVLCHHEV